MARGTAGLFDLRLVIAALFAVYGVVLVVVGLGFTDDADLAKADGWNVNLWSGVGMVVVAAAFGAWTALRPLVVPDPEEVAEEEGADARERGI